VKEKLKCQINKCKKIIKKVNQMSYYELEKQNIKCSNCGNWILKESKLANITYENISNKYAVEFNKNRYLN